MDAILLKGVRTHTLKNIDLILPHKKFYVITGVSGSGKSSLAFDTLYAEGQRRYVESLSAYARQFLERMEKPEAEAITGIPPAIAIEAKNVITNARSTVGTQTEINDYLRVFFARLGRIICPDCETEVAMNRPETVSGYLMKNFQDQEAAVLYPVSLGKQGAKYLKEFLPELERQGFQEFFYGKKFFSSAELLKLKKIEDPFYVSVDRVKATAKNAKRLCDSLEQAFRYGRGKVKIVTPQKIFEFSENLACHTCGKTYKEPTPNLFSFNSPLGACSACQGFGRVITIDWNLVIPDVKRSLSEGAVEPWTKPSAAQERRQLLKFCERKKIPTAKPWKDLSQTHRDWILNGCKGDDYFSVKDFFAYLEKKTYKMHVRIFLAKYRCFVPCSDCRETRLKPEALAVRFRDKTIYDYQVMSLGSLWSFFENLKLPEIDKKRVEPVYLEITRRLRFLKEVGLGYLSLARLSRTLSGGEVQRIHLATSLGSALVDTLYVLDEPSIGLHDRDNRLLIRLLMELRDLGNTLVVVEHDRTMIESADEVIDMGPLGGEKGGRVIFQGTLPQIKKSPKSLTGQYLSGRLQVKRRSQVQSPSKKEIRIRGAVRHNLKNIDVDIPLNRLTVLTGVSGSGKSTLLYDILYGHFLRHRGRPVQDLGEVKSIEGFDLVDDIVLVDQSPIGRTPRSNPATYLKAYDDIRKIFARVPDAKQQGFEAGHFSFNVDGGRCPVCKGDGRIKVEMHFLADVFVECEECRGKRFKPEILEIRYQGKNIDDVLAMSIDDAAAFFPQEKTLLEKLSLLQRVGLGYLRMGQSAITLSGGEAQRLKLASEMSERRGQHLLYLFDEPTTGLHYHDIHYLMEAFDELLSRGHSLVLIEHNMEIIRSADYVIDLGPEGGEAGGNLLFEGTVEKLLNCSKSYTSQYLRKYVEESKTLRPAAV